MEEKLLHEILTEIKDIKVGINKMDTRMGNMETRMDSMDTRMDTMKSTLDEHTDLLHALEHRTEENTAQLTALSENVHYIEGQINRLNNEVYKQGEFLEMFAIKNAKQEAELFEMKRTLVAKSK